MRSAAVVALVCLACSSHYMPRSRGRVSVTVIDGKQFYVRDGQTYPAGVLGGGLAQAVGGNAAAETAAHEFHDRMRDGLLGVIGGTLAMVGGMTYGMVEYAQQNQNNTRVDPVPLGVMVVGVAILAWGTARLATAEPYRWDAINIFNDAGDVAPPTSPIGPPGYGYGAAPPTAPPPSPLRMRSW